MKKPLQIVRALGALKADISEAKTSAKDNKLDVNQIMFLLLVYNGSEDGVAMDYLAKQIGITHPTIGQNAKRLSALVELLIDPVNSRYRYVKIRPEGRRVVEAFLAKLES